MKLLIKLIFLFGLLVAVAYAQEETTEKSTREAPSGWQWDVPSFQDILSSSPDTASKVGKIPEPDEPMSKPLETPVRGRESSIAGEEAEDDKLEEPMETAAEDDSSDDIEAFDENLTQATDEEMEKSLNLKLKLDIKTSKEGAEEKESESEESKGSEGKSSKRKESEELRSKRAKEMKRFEDEALKQEARALRWEREAGYRLRKALRDPRFGVRGYPASEFFKECNETDTEEFERCKEYNLNKMKELHEKAIGFLSAKLSLVQNQMNALNSYIARLESASMSKATKTHPMLKERVDMMKKVALHLHNRLTYKLNRLKLALLILQNAEITSYTPLSGRYARRQMGASMRVGPLRYTVGLRRRFATEESERLPAYEESERRGSFEETKRRKPSLEEEEGGHPSFEEVRRRPNIERQVRRIPLRRIPTRSASPSTDYITSADGFETN